jgi:hypothetical protein
MQAIRMSIPAGAKQAAGKGLILVRNLEKHASGAKAPADFSVVTYGLKPVPFTGTTFSAGCKAQRPHAVECSG